MMETVLTAVFSTVLFVTSATLTPQTASPSVAFTRVLPEKNYVGYTVEKTEPLSAVAAKYYGSEDYWTTIWNDNPSLIDLDHVQEGKLLKMRVEKPQEPEQLTHELEQRDAEEVQKQNDQYLQSIGYANAMSTPESTVVPTVTQSPTKTPAPVVAQGTATSNSASTISEEAINYLGSCEAGMDPAKNTGNGYYGAFQFSYGTWKSMNTGYERADLAPIEVQKAAVKQLLQRSSIHNQFPGCASKMRNAGLI